MKLLILTHNFPPRREVSRNAGVFVLSFALALSKLGHRVYVLMPDTAEGKENYPEFKIIWFSWRGRGKELRELRWYWPPDLLSMFSLIKNGVYEAIKLAEEENIEYCSAMWIIPAGYIACQVKKRLGIPYSVWVLGADIWTYGRSYFLRRIMRKVISEAHSVFSNSQYLKAEVKKMFNRECDLLYAVRSLPLDTPAALVHKDFFNFLFIGRYEQVKGLDILLKAFRLLLNEKKDVYLYVFGGGELKNNYMEMINESGLKEHVSINDYASPELTVSFLKACQCLVIPSRRESQPVLLTDAIQVKTPVIVSRTGDMGEIVRDFNIGEVVDIEDAHGLKDAMARVMDRGSFEYQSNLENASQAINTFSMAKNYIEKICSGMEFQKETPTTVPQDVLLDCPQDVLLD